MESVVELADSGLESADSTTDYAKKSSEDRPVGSGYHIHHHQILLNYCKRRTH